MKSGTAAGRMPANVLVSARAIVTAGFTKDVNVAANNHRRGIAAAERGQIDRNTGSGRSPARSAQQPRTPPELLSSYPSMRLALA